MIPEDDESEEPETKKTAETQVNTFYRIAFSTGYQWLLDQVIKVRAPFELIILMLKDAVDENADSRSNVFFGEFATQLDGDVYLQGVNYIADGLLHAFQDPSLEAFRNPGASGSLLNMISYGVNSLTDLPPLRSKPASDKGDSALNHQEYPALPTLVMEFLWQMLELALRRPHHMEFVQLLLDSIAKIAPLSPFEVVDRIEERLAELLEETRKKIMEQRGEAQPDDQVVEEDNSSETSSIIGDTIKVKEQTFSDNGRSEISVGRFEDFDDRTSMVSSVLLSKNAPVEEEKIEDYTSVKQDEQEEVEPEAEVEAAWMRYVQAQRVHTSI